MDDTIGDLIAARAWLINLHASAEGARNPKLLRHARTLLGAADTMIAALTPPPPARVRNSLRQPAPQTVPGDFRPTLYAPEYARTQPMEAHQ